MSARHAPTTLVGLLAMGLLAAAVGFAGVLSTSTPAQAKDWDSDKDNVIVSIPESPAPWAWLTYKATWAKAGVIKGASRGLTKLKRTGEAADGHGALMHLAVRDAGEMTLQEAAEDDKIREFLLGRLKGTEGDVESEEITVDTGTGKAHPAIVLRTKGKAANLKSKENICTAYMVLTITRGKLYLLRMFAFHTEDDDDGLVYDLDYMEANCLRLISTKESKKAKAAPKKGGDGKGDGEGGEEEVREDETLEHRAQGWRITIDGKLLRQEITEEERELFLELKCGESDRMGGYTSLRLRPSRRASTSTA